MHRRVTHAAIRHKVAELIAHPDIAPPTPGTLDELKASAQSQTDEIT